MTSNDQPKKKIQPWQRRHGPQVAVKVTQKHIDESMQKDSSHCMIAEAIKDALPTAKYISVDLQTIRWTDPKKGVRYIVLTPRMAQEKLVAFDQGLLDILEPFDFQMRPAQILKSGTQGHPPDESNRTGDAKASVNTSVDVDQDSANVSVGDPVVKASDPKPKRTHVRRKSLSIESNNSVPITLGGTPPPRSVLARREFGLRALRK